MGTTENSLSNIRDPFQEQMLLEFMQLYNEPLTIIDCHSFPVGIVKVKDKRNGIYFYDESKLLLLPLLNDEDGLQTLQEKTKIDELWFVVTTRSNECKEEKIFNFLANCFIGHSSAKVFLMDLHQAKIHELL